MRFWTLLISFLLIFSVPMHAYAAECENGLKDRTDISSLRIKCIDRMKPGQRWPVSVYVFPGNFNEKIIWSSSDESVASVCDGVVSGVSDGVAIITAQGECSGISDSVSVCVDSDLKQIALTFDDGPGNRTMQLLSELDKLDVRCTFFICGYRMSSYAEAISRMVQDGHEIGFHSWSHGRLKSMSREQIQKEFYDFQSTLSMMTGSEAEVWRCPFGEANNFVRSCIDLPECLWNLDTLDWNYRDPDRLEKFILKNVKDGAVILCHDLFDETVEGVINAVKKLACRDDVQFLTATEIFERNGERICSGRCYR